MFKVWPKGQNFEEEKFYEKESMLIFFLMFEVELFSSIYWVKKIIHFVKHFYICIQMLKSRSMTKQS